MALVSAVNVSEGRDRRRLDALVAAGGDHVLDVHRDPDHNRSVVTLGGRALEEAVRALAATTVATIDLRTHGGVHPRFGALDVVPFAPAALADPADVTWVGAATEARDRFASWAGETLALPCFVYGPERSLPEVRRRAFVDLPPDTGPPSAHPTAGACAVGARGPLLAYNLWLSSTDVAVARALAAGLRGPAVRALGLATGGVTQVSCNLVDPLRVGPADVYDETTGLARAAGTAITRTELVGLAPAAVVEATAPWRWRQLDLDPSRTFEARLAAVTRR